MKLLKFLDEGGHDLPPRGGHDPAAGLAREDPRAYGRWIAHLCSFDARLDRWRDPLTTGEAVVVLTGQQPGLLGGPLYTLYKALTAAHAARRLGAGGRPALAAFWCVGDDTDHDEVASASWPRRSEAPTRVRDEASSGGMRIGELPPARMDEAIARLAADWPGASPLREKLAQIRAASAGAGWSGFLRHALGSLLPDPFLFVDGNDPASIDVAQPWLRRALGLRGDLARELESELSRVRAGGGTPALTGEEAPRCVFAVEGAGRRLLDEEEEPPRGVRLLPNVILRPGLQEHLLPVARVVCGDAEIAYRSLLGGVYEVLGRRPAPLLRRFRATLFPPVWASDPGAPDPERALRDADGTLEAWAEGGLDRALVAELLGARARTREALEALEAPLGALDRGLAQLLVSVRGKVDFQIGRVEEALRGKARQLLHRRGGELAHLREFLRPRGAAQERSFTLWTPWLYERALDTAALERCVEAWFDRGEDGHALLALESEGE